MGLYLKQGIACIVIMFALLLFLIQKNKHKVYYFFIKRRKIFLIIFISAIISNIYLNLTNLKFKKVYNEFPIEVKKTATVKSDAKETEYYKNYNIDVDGKTFILYVKKNFPQELKYGMLITIEGTYTRPPEDKNYKGFNYREYLKTKKIYGTIKAQKLNIIKENNLNIILNLSNKIRTKVIDVAKEILPTETSSLVTGILIGEKNDISEEITDAFSKASISHILAISGTHVSYIILGITYILTKSKVSKRRSYLCTISFLILFMFITRFSSSVVRASIMSILMIFAKIIHRKSDTLNSIALSLLIILSFNPYAIKDIGLELSYLGTLGIVLLNTPISKFLEKYTNEKLAKILSITISAQIMVLPITALYFNIIYTNFILSNIIAAPLAGIIILFRIFKYYYWNSIFTTWQSFRKIFKYNSKPSNLYIKNYCTNTFWIFHNKNTEHCCGNRVLHISILYIEEEKNNENTHHYNNNNNYFKCYTSNTGKPRNSYCRCRATEIVLL